MVKFFKFCLPLLILGCFTGCRIDVLGLVGSTDLATRLEERDNFRFLTDSDRTLSLGEEYSFIVLNDIHIKNGNIWGLEKLKTVIDENSEIKFAIIAGDITDFGAAQDIEKFVSFARTLGIPCYPVIGNHDIFFGNWTQWKNRIGSTRYRIDGDGTALFILDSANAFFGKDQFDWIERELKTTEGRVFVFSHTNLFVESLKDVEQFADTKERARIVSILRNRCDIMFMGHVHKRIIKETGNVKYITIEDYRTNRIYCLVSVEKSGVSYKFEKL